MRYIMAFAALACIASTSTPAAAKVRPRLVAMNQTQAADAVSAKRDPYGVYVDGELIGRDPDPNVRAEIRASYGGRFAPVCAAR